MTFNDKLKASILKHAKAHPSNKSCDVVMQAVMTELDFDLKPLLKYCFPFKSGIDKKIKALDEAAIDEPGYCVKLSPEEAARLATINGGEYIILALLYKDIAVPGIGNPVSKHHVAIVIDGPCARLNGPAIGGGGMTQEFIDRGWVLSNARIHFTDWKSTNYYMYCYKKGMR